MTNAPNQNPQSYNPYQPATGSLFLDSWLNFYSAPRTPAEYISYSAGLFNDVNTFQNLAARGFLPVDQGTIFSRTTGRYLFGPLVHITSAAEFANRALNDDFSGAAASLAANEAGFFAGDYAAARAMNFLISRGFPATWGGALGTAGGFFAGGAVTYGVGMAAEAAASWNPDVSPAPQMFRGADGRLYYVGNDAVFGGSGKLVSGDVTPVYGIGDGRALFGNFAPNLSDIPLIDRGPAPNGYDIPWGNSSGPWGSVSTGASYNSYANRAGASGAASGVSFLGDGPAAPASRSGANGSFFGNDFGDVNLPGRGGVGSASAGASGVFSGASYAAAPGGVGPYDFASGFAGNVAGAAGSAASGVGAFLASGNYSAGFIPGGVGLSVNWGNGTPNANLPGFGQGGHNANWGGASNDGFGFNSLGDLGNMAKGFVSDVRNLVSSVGN